MTNHEDAPFVTGHGSRLGSEGTHVQLSPQAMLRKQEMFGELQKMVHRQGRNRRVARVAIPACAAASLVLIGVLSARLVGTNQPSADPRPGVGSGIAAVIPDPDVPLPSSSGPEGGRSGDADVQHMASAPAYSSITLVTVPATPSIIVREVSTSKTIQLARTIDDDELIALLASSGRSCGIIRTGTHTSVVCNSCDRGETIFDPPSFGGDAPPKVPNAGTM
ncbi:MAG: hypothetical protein H7210_14285 [Pyrinomonadaceae bacterium]|nr:hypothetical protein [Phycisphaerales bacterium]